METNDRVFREAAKMVGGDDFMSLAFFWPSAGIRRENQDRWDRFWKEGRERKLKELISSTSSPYGFSDRAFGPFFQGLYAHHDDAASPGGIIAQLQERFVVSKKDEYSVMSFFPDEKRNFESLTE